MHFTTALTILLSTLTTVIAMPSPSPRALTVRQDGACTQAQADAIFNACLADCQAFGFPAGTVCTDEVCILPVCNICGC